MTNTLFLIGILLISLSVKGEALDHNESEKAFKEPSTMIKSIGLSWILVDDLKESIKFYTEIIGLKVVRFDEESGWAELSGLEGGQRFGIGQKSYYEEIHPGKNAIVSLPVEDIVKIKADLMKKGVKMLGETIEYLDCLKLQTFVDLDGNCFQLIQVIH